MGVFSLAAELWRRCRSLARASSAQTISASNSGDWTHRRRGGDDDTRKRTLLLYGQSVWMSLTLTLLVGLELWSLRLYFVVSFIGLLLNRLLFAPARRTERWWRVVSAVTWLCFAGLAYLVVLRVRAVGA